MAGKEITARLKPDGSRVRAIGMVSGGLDSLLAARTLLEQGIELICFTADIGFSADSRLWAKLSDVEPAASPVAEEYMDLGDGHRVPLLKVDLREDYRQILLSPRHGYGGNLNPCIDCHAFMARAAKRLMKRYDADFVFTGEVLGQRPMSQQLRGIKQVAKDGELEGRLLRPLCARNLEPTEAELSGLVDRERLHAFQGRSRKPQIALAAKYGITDFPSPAGGCQLTEPSFASRLNDLLVHADAGAWPDEEQFLLLRLGRHFRISAAAKLVIGRDHAENELMQKICPLCWQMEAVDFPGPLAILHCDLDCQEGDFETAAELVARYGKGKNESRVKVKMREGNEGLESLLDVVPCLDEEMIERLRVPYRMDKTRRLDRLRD